ncbi:MAG: hypothetical protein U0996_11495 [Planctomycetaceae bacterium]
MTFQKAQEQHAAIEKLVPKAKLSADRRLYFLFRRYHDSLPGSSRCGKAESHWKSCGMLASMSYVAAFWM